MIVLGGYTRLSKSGLSMTNWKPLGYKYPENQEQWLFEFENYKQTPEYKIGNPDITLQQFKNIFFVEYFHRSVGSALGFTFSLPMIYFGIRGYFTRLMFQRLSVMFILGGL